jgi:tetratricopeptide (TPR) repeat protein
VQLNLLSARWRIEMRGNVLVILIFLVCFLGCEPPKPKAKAVAGSGGGPVVVSSGPVVVAAPLSEAQKELFVSRMLSVARGENQPQDFLDADQLFSRTADIAGVPSAQREAFISGTKRGYATNSLSKIIVGETSKGGSFHFLRFSKRDGFETAIFRFIRADTALSYFEFAMPPSNATNFGVAPDVYAYISSEWMSQTSANVSLQLRAAEDPSVLNKLFRSAGLSSSDANTFKTIIDKGKIQDWRGVITAYHALPAAMQQSKICLMFRFNAATRLQDNVEITSVVEDLRKYCGNDAGIEFLSLDYYLIRKEFGKAMNSVDSLERFVGVDPYIDVLRGNISLQAGDTDQALVAGKRAAEREPTLEAAQMLVATAALSRSDFASLASAFRALQKMGKVTVADVEANAAYAQFRESPEFAAWRDGR